MIHPRDVDRLSPLRTHENVPHGSGDLDMERVIGAAADAVVECVLYENELDTDPNSEIEDGAALLKHC